MFFVKPGDLLRYLFRGINAGASVDFPAPFGPAMTTTLGIQLDPVLKFIGPDHLYQRLLGE